jgi:hypothetical protein
MGDYLYNGKEESTKINIKQPENLTPSFFADVQTSEFVSIPININHNDREDQTSSFIDYSENVFKSSQDRQRDVIFKYEEFKPKVVEEDATSNIKFHQKRRDTLSRDRVPTRKGWSRAQRQRFNAFAQSNQNINMMDMDENVKIYSDYNKNYDPLNA